MIGPQPVIGKVIDASLTPLEGTIYFACDFFIGICNRLYELSTKNLASLFKNKS